MAATFQTISSTREEYIATVESLKASGPDDSKSSEKRSKVEQNHLALVKSLEDRIEGIDNELNVSDVPQFPPIRQDEAILCPQSLSWVFYRLLTLFHPVASGKSATEDRATRRATSASRNSHDKNTPANA